MSQKFGQGFRLLSSRSHSLDLEKGRTAYLRWRVPLGLPKQANTWVFVFPAQARLIGVKSEEKGTKPSKRRTAAER